jgi:hypothetical protein
MLPWLPTLVLRIDVDAAKSNDTRLTLRPAMLWNRSSSNGDLGGEAFFGDAFLGDASTRDPSLGRRGDP